MRYVNRRFTYLLLLTDLCVYRCCLVKPACCLLTQSSLTSSPAVVSAWITISMVESCFRRFFSTRFLGLALVLSAWYQWHYGNTCNVCCNRNCTSVYLFVCLSRCQSVCMCRCQSVCMCRCLCSWLTCPTTVKTVLRCTHSKASQSSSIVGQTCNSRLFLRYNSPATTSSAIPTRPMSSGM